MAQPSILDALVAHVTETAQIAQDAVVSGAWIYPLQGIYYFLSHPSLFRSFAPVIGRLIITYIGITAALFVFTYLPHVAFCALFSGPFAFFTATVMILGESYVLILLVGKTFFLAKAQDRVFDAVMIQQGHEVLVSHGRPIISGSSSGMKKLGQSFVKPLSRFSKDGLLRYVISLPLNAIPFVGTVLFLLYNGMKAGPGFHTRYFQLKEFDASRRAAFVTRRKGAYTGFGAAALALNLIPLFGLVFGFTSSVGAALWASEIEAPHSKQTGTGREGLNVVDKLSEVPVEM